MKIFGLTGSIGMGKSVLAKQFRSIGVPVHDADACVHDLLSPNGAAFNAVQTDFPSAVINGVIDRSILGKIIFANPDKRHRLELILHPLVRQSSAKFIRDCRRKGFKTCILDIPLLFETGRDDDVDQVICVTAPKWVQARRVLSRPNMTQDKFNAILNLQMPDHRKRHLSDHLILTCRGKRYSLNAAKRLKRL